MESKHKQETQKALPPCVVEYVEQVTKQMRYRRRARAEVGAELRAHFEDALKDCTDAEQRETKARELIEQFGDAKLLAVLCRWAKKRCRPLWQKACIRTAQAAALILLYGVLCSARLFVGRPSVTVDYVAWLSDHVRQGRDESLNAKPDIERAARMAAELSSLNDVLPKNGFDWPRAMNESERQAVAKLIDESAEAFDALGEALRKSDYWTDYRSSEPNGPQDSADNSTGLPQVNSGLVYPMAVNEAVNPSLANYRKLAQKLRLRALQRAWQGNLEGAFDDCLALYRIGWRLEGQGLLVEQLVGIALEALANATIETIMANAEVSADLLQRAQRELQKGFASQQKLLDVTAEKIFLYDYIQQTFTDDGGGRGRPLKAAMPLVVGDWRTGVRGLVTFSYPGRRETKRKVDAFYDELERSLEQMPWEMGPEDRLERLGRAAEGSFMLEILCASHLRLGNLTWRLQTGRRADLTILAAQRFHRDRGVYPDMLGTLVTEGYLDQVPIDPYSGRPFAYRRTNDGFLLYSWGENRQDDGGQMGTGYKGQPRMFADNGDWVFWPQSRSE